MLKWSRSDCVSHLKQNKLLLATMLGITIGTVIGIGLRPLEPSYTVIAWIKIWGEIFLRLFKAIILPLVLSCIVVAITNLEGKTSGKLGILTLLYIIITTAIATTAGIVLCLSIRPGEKLADTITDVVTKEPVSYTDIFTDFIRNLIPDNIISSSFQTVYTNQEISNRRVNDTNETEVVSSVKRQLRHRYGINTLGMVSIGIALALGIQKTGAKAKPLKDVFQALYHVVFTIVKAILWYSPIGVGCMVAGALMQEKDLTGAFSSLGLFVLCFALAFMIHSLVLMPLMYLIIVRKNPFKYYTRIIEGMLAGFASTNSATAMTFLLKDCERKLKVKSDIVVFVLPTATVLNRDGSAMFITSATIFIAQSQGIILTTGDVFTIGALVTLLSASVANIPSGSIVIIIMVCSSINIPITERLGLILAVEWLLDRLRTTNNVIGNAFGCAIVGALMEKLSNNTALVESNNDEESGTKVMSGTGPVKSSTEILLTEPLCNTNVSDSLTSC